MDAHLETSPLESYEELVSDADSGYDDVLRMWRREVKAEIVRESEGIKME